MRKHDQSSVAAEGARRADLNTVVARLEARSAELEVRLIKWMIGTVLGGVSLLRMFMSSGTWCAMPR